MHLQSDPITYRMELVVFGQSKPKIKENLHFPVHYLGHINDDLSFNVIYNSADLMVVPSRQEAFGQTALEAQACGIPVVAFKVGGLVDIVDHLKTGYLAEPNDPYDLASGIVWVLKNNLKKQISLNARKKAETSFSDFLVGERYLRVYEKILA
jgi:glycosyltransferase involved in cell wall biosynthesis